MSEKDVSKTLSFIVDYKTKIQKEFGDVIFLAEDGLPSEVKTFVSTGATLLDFAISNRKNGGIPVGKLIEVSGENSTGKSLFAVQVARNAQKDGALVVYMDTEHAFNEDFAKTLGLDTKNNFIYMTPSTMDDVFSSMFLLFKKLDEAEKGNKKSPYPYAVVIWDSIPASPSKLELNAENPDPTATVGLTPRILSKNLKMLLAQSGRKNVAQIFINQLRTNIGAGPFSSEKYITTGGKALPYYASVRVWLHNMGKVKIGDVVVGVKVKAVVRKTRFGPPFRESHFIIYFDRGVDDTESVLDYLVNNDVISTKSGGSKGKLFWIKKERGDKGDAPENPALPKNDFMRKMREDKELKEFIENELDRLLVRETINTAENSLEETVVGDDE